MLRATAAIRKLLVLETMEARLRAEIAKLKTEMQAEGITIRDYRMNDVDVTVEYEVFHHLYEAIYMRKMLDAESNNRVKRAGIAT